MAIAPAKPCGKAANGRNRRPVAFTPSAAFKPRFQPAARLNDLVPAVIKPVFERYGFSSAEILTKWAAYAGADVARYTAPERLKWPREHGEKDTGATLILRVDGARALDVQYKIPQLIERINAAFGYRAVTSIKLIQAPLPPAAAKPRFKSEAPAKGGGASVTGEPRLDAALARIAAGIETRRSARQAQLT